MERITSYNIKKLKKSNLDNDIERVTKEIVLNSLTKQFQSVNNIVFNLKEVKYPIDYYYEKMKLIELKREGLVEIQVKDGKKFYKLK